MTDHTKRPWIEVERHRAYLRSRLARGAEVVCVCVLDTQRAPLCQTLGRPTTCSCSRRAPETWWNGRFRSPMVLPKQGPGLLVRRTSRSALSVGLEQR